MTAETKVEAVETDEGVKIDVNSWNRLNIKDLPTIDIVKLSQLQRSGNIRDYTNFIAQLIQARTSSKVEDEQKS